MSAVGRDLEGDVRTLDAARLSAVGKAFVDASREPADAAADDAGKLALAIVGAFVDVETGRARRLSGPQIALPPADPDKAQIVEVDVAVMAALDVPEQYGVAEAVIRGLRKGAGAGDRAAAVVEPVADDVPAGNVAHQDLHSRAGRRGSA